ncbi:CysS/YqeB C-terminal domain-containing protein [Salinicoccus carnicancri]
MRRDLMEIGIVIKDKNGRQYVRIANRQSQKVQR